MCIQKQNRHSFKEKKKRRKGKSSAYHHSTDVETKCVGLSVSSQRLSTVKLQRWPVWIDQVNQLQPRKKRFYSVCNLLPWQRWKSGWHPSAAKGLWPNRGNSFSKKMQWRHSAAGQYSRQVADESAEWKITELACCLPLLSLLAKKEGIITKRQTL